MRQLIRISVLLAIIFLSIHTSESSVRLQNTPGVFAAWNLTNPSTPIVANGRVTYSLDSAGSDDIPFSQVEQAITASFQSWEDIPTSTIAFQRGPNITSDKTFHEDQFDIYWVEDSEMVNGMDISGALAVTFSDSNAQTGEFTGIAMVFNGVSFTWATDGRAGSLDVQAVATHEIGHSIGLDHSPIAASTMFPTTGEGRLEERTLSRDDQIAASIIYPTPDFFSTTGIVSGQVLDNTGAPIFGAHVVAVDANGVVITGALSQSNGTYSIAGLPSGSYNIYAQPLGSNDNKFFSRGNLSSTYSNADIDFQTSQDFPVFVNPGMTTPLQI
ncbi:MAG: matrixin family metalloprotease, partial [Blastocatellia bacterium]|nr:matrixin family metalloprotease [Blastocatellia bacterium]